MDTKRETFYQLKPGEQPATDLHPVFTTGELIPLRGAFWRLVHCGGNKLILEYAHPTAATAKKMKAAEKGKRKRP